MFFILKWRYTVLLLFLTWEFCEHNGCAQGVKTGSKIDVDPAYIDRMTK